MSSETAEFLAGVNATLNGASFVLLLGAYALVRMRLLKSHAALMLTALSTSTGFLVCYLILHANVPPRSFSVPAGPVRTIYFAILMSHTILAVVILPLVLMTLYRAIRQRWDRHRQIARWTFPLWLYVSLTGVVIYWMLYHLAPAMNRAAAN